jgi:hypothetical protein
MTYQRVVISSGHGKYVRGASGILDEVDEARRVVDYLADELRARGVDVTTYHDDVSCTQSENLTRIVDFHNSKSRELDISVHFNAFEQREAPVGCEVWYVTQAELADQVSAAIAAAGFIDRGPKKSNDLAFLNNTDMPAILIEVCFVDSEVDCEVYQREFDAISENIADVLGGEEGTGEVPDRPEHDEVYTVIGRCSTFGGPDDTGVSEGEGLAFIDKVMDAPHLFLPEGAPGTEGMGLARRLNPHVHYIACRWDYDLMSKSEMIGPVAKVRALNTGIELTAFPADWGPHEDTGRVADLSPGLMRDLGIGTDDEVKVTFPHEEDTA